MPDMSDEELLSALGVDSTPEKKVTRTPREERIIAGFEEIQRFIEERGRLPEHGEKNDIFERLYATRLDQICKQKDCRELLLKLDHQGLLDESSREEETPVDELDDNALLAQLGVTEPDDGDVTHLQHVKPRAEIRAAEEIANRTPCNDFDRFKPIFEAVQKEMDSGARETRPFRGQAEIRKGDLFILSGQKVYVADVGEEFVTDYERKDSELHVIYDNGTESNIRARSLQRALNKDSAGRRITDNSPGPLFSGVAKGDDLASGTIYVLSSKSELPVIRENRDIIHKIGVTSGSIEKRIANAKFDPTFLMADVKVVATYELYNINRIKLENLIHRFFDSVRLDIQINDRFGQPVAPREWFLAPLFIVDEVVEKIKGGTIGKYAYDAKSVTLTRISHKMDESSLVL